HRLSKALPQAVKQSDADELPSTLTLLGRFRSKESRRALAAGAAILESFRRAVYCAARQQGRLIHEQSAPAVSQSLPGTASPDLKSYPAEPERLPGPFRAGAA